MVQIQRLKLRNTKVGSHQSSASFHHCPVISYICAVLLHVHHAFPSPWPILSFLVKDFNFNFVISITPNQIVTTCLSSNM